MSPSGEQIIGRRFIIQADYFIVRDIVGICDEAFHIVGYDKNLQQLFNSDYNNRS